MTSFKQVYLPKAPSPNTITLCVRASPYEQGGEGRYSYSIASPSSVTGAVWVRLRQRGSLSGQKGWREGISRSVHDGAEDHSHPFFPHRPTPCHTHIRLEERAIIRQSAVSGIKSEKSQLSGCSWCQHSLIFSTVLGHLHRDNHWFQNDELAHRGASFTGSFQLYSKYQRKNWFSEDF